MIKKVLLLAAAGPLLAIFTACSSPTIVKAEVSPNCVILQDSFFSYRPISNKEANPRGYFDEVVSQQEGFVARLDALTPQDAEEAELLEDVLRTSEVLLGFYVIEQQRLVPGETRQEFWDGMTKAQKEDWQSVEPILRGKTEENLDSLDSYAAYCGMN
jgi:hypothetical protein